MAYVINPLVPSNPSLLHMPLSMAKKRQLELNIYKGKRGGRRPGAGRKRIHSRGVAHREREHVNHRLPMHINFKYRLSIRNKECLKILKRAILNARGWGLRIIHFSLQSNHVHLIVEADNNEILTRGMRSLTVTMAKRIAKGRIQLERYHLHVLRSLRETRNAVFYVLQNEQRHTGTSSTAYTSVDNPAYSPASFLLVKALSTS